MNDMYRQFHQAMGGTGSVQPQPQAPASPNAFQQNNITSPSAVAIHEGANLAAEKGLHGMGAWATKAIPNAAGMLTRGATKMIGKAFGANPVGAIVGDMVAPKEANAGAQIPTNVPMVQNARGVWAPQ
jgi:hypothetical protein